MLRNAYELLQPELDDSLPSAGFEVVSSGQLAEENASFDPSVTLYLYRVSFNNQLRNARSQSAPGGTRPLSLDLHYLMTVWASNALHEHMLLAWTMRELNEHPILDMGSLNPEGGWTAEDVVHIVPAELSVEDLMRIWDTLTPAYRLSHSYTARVIRIDPSNIEHPRPTVARRELLSSIID